jgi:putative acetyltransferase
MESVHIRNILPADNPAIAAIIRATFKEFGLDRPGTAYYDKVVDDMYTAFQTPGSRYHVGLTNDRILGGGGIYPSPGLPEKVCELVKMYLLPSARGLGLGKSLLEKNLEFARTAGYRQVYIETMPEFDKAVSLYERYGFSHLNGAMGNTGHYSCSVWMLLDL